MNLSDVRSKMLLLENDSNYFGFITSLMLSLPMSESDKIPTACATDTELLFNPKFLASCTDNQAVGLMCHEVLHVVLEHIARREHRDPMTHNYACDAVINEIILSELGLELPCDPVTFSSLGVTDTTMSSEELYEVIKGKPKPSGSPEMYDLDPAQGSKGSEVVEGLGGLPKGEELEQLITSSVVLNGFDWSEEDNNEITRKIRELVDPKVPWETALLGLMFDYVISEEATWDMFNPRYFTMPMLMPGFAEDKEKLVANCYVDISGSLSDELVTSILSEIKGIKTTFEDAEINVITWNTQIVSEFSNVVDVEKLKIVGIGGTNIKCVFNHIGKSKPKLAIIFTDGYFYQADYTHKATELVWVVQNGELQHEYPGKVIEL